MPPDLVELLDARAAALGLSRSAYVQQLVRRDVGLGSVLQGSGLTDEPTPYITRTPRSAKKPGK